MEIKDCEKLSQRLEMLAQETLRESVIWRAAYTKEYAMAGNLIKQWMSEAGLKVYEDPVGNIFGRIEGTESKTIMTGSHLDTVKNGGKYDGAAGIITAISAVKSLLRENGRPKKSIEVVALIEEEGSRFASSYIGSRGITGRLKEEDMEETDSGGVTLFEAMKSAGYSPENFREAKRDDLEAFIELHIEQGPRLEKSNKEIGVVCGIVGIYSYDVVITGKQNHAGTTPMNMRKDPVRAAADFILKISDFAEKQSETATLTVGAFRAEPGMSNVIAEKVSLSLDLRDSINKAMKAMDIKIRKEIACLKENGFDVEISKKCDEEPVALSPEITKKIEEAAEESGASYMKMNSGAGHDSQIFAEFVPAGMIFIPSHDGISHSPEEYTGSSELNGGADVLKRVLRKLSY